MSLSSTETLLRLLLGAGLIASNGFFVAIEFALTRARQYSEEEFADNKRLQLAWNMTEDLEIYLTGCQVGITASSIALGVVAEPAVAALIEPVFHGSWLGSIGFGSLLAFLFINFVHVTHGEQTPTYLGVEESKTVCQYGAPPLYGFTKVVKPVIRVDDFIAKLTLKLIGVEMTGSWKDDEIEAIESRAELRARVGELLTQGDLPDERQEEVLNAIEVDDRKVRDIMVPKEQMTVLSTEVRDAENRRRIESQPHTRYPLIGESLDDVHGIVYTSAFVKEVLDKGEDNIDLASVAAPPMTIDAETTVSKAIDQFQAEGQEIALVLGEGGEVIGLVTVTDALEEVVGEIYDPLDEEYRGEGP